MKLGVMKLLMVGVVCIKREVNPYRSKVMVAMSRFGDCSSV